MTNAPGKARKFSYRRRTSAEVEKKLQIMGLGDAIYEAHKRSPEKLLAYLRSNLPLSHLEPYRDELADLIERFIKRKKRGQRGKAVPTAKGDMQALFVARCHGLLKRVRAKNGGKAPKGAIDRVMDEVGMSGEFDGEDIDLEAAGKALRKQR
jgi:hypothetical protein